MRYNEFASGSVFHSEFSPKECGAIRESLDYTGIFDDIFAHYLKSVENAGVKTTGMDSMFRRFCKIGMKDRKEEKASAFNEPGAKNGNLQIAVLPFSEVQNICNVKEVRL